MDRTLSGLTTRGALLAAAVLCVFPITVSSAQTPAPSTRPAPAAFDPSDVYFQAWLLSKDAEKLVEEGKHLEALNKLRRARQMFGEISQNFPTWKPEMLRGRVDKTIQDIAKVTPDALKQEQGNNRATAELEGGVRRHGIVEGDAPRALEMGLPVAPIQPARPIETLDSRRIAELEQETARLKQQINTGRQAGGSETAEARRQRDIAFAQLKQRQAELDQLRRKTGSQPMQEEVRALSQRIDSLEREKSAMGEALGSSQSEAKQAKVQIDALQAERVRLMQEVANLSKNLEIERKTANEVVPVRIRPTPWEFMLYYDMWGATRLDAELRPAPSDRRGPERRRHTDASERPGRRPAPLRRRLGRAPGSPRGSRTGRVEGSRVKGSSSRGGSRCCCCGCPG